MKQQGIEEVYKLQKIRDTKVVSDRINGQHPEDQVLKPFGVDDF